MKLKRILTSCFAVSALVSGQALADSEVRGAVTAVSNVASGVAAQTPHNGFRRAKEESDSIIDFEVRRLIRPRRSDHDGMRWVANPKAATGPEVAADDSANASQPLRGGSSATTPTSQPLGMDHPQRRRPSGLDRSTDQSASRWIIRNDADQSASRWIIVNLSQRRRPVCFSLDHPQRRRPISLSMDYPQRCRSVSLSMDHPQRRRPVSLSMDHSATTPSQSASRWIIRNDADQSASRWIIRNDADQSASRWIIR